MVTLSRLLGTIFILSSLLGLPQSQAQVFVENLGKYTSDFAVPSQPPPPKVPFPKVVKPPEHPLPAQWIKGPCPPQKFVLDPKQASALREAQVAVMPDNFLIPPNHFGQCLNDGSTLLAGAQRAQAEWLAARLPVVKDKTSGKLKPKLMKQLPEGGSVPATDADLMAYDVLLRTLSAEVGWTRCSTEAQKATARIILNRIKYYEDRQAERAKKTGSSQSMEATVAAEGSDNDVSLSPRDHNEMNNLIEFGVLPIPDEMMRAHPIVPVVMNKNKFSAWNPASPSFKTSKCPENLGEMNQLKKIASIAADAIFRQRDFMNQTAEVTARDYTSGDWMREVRQICQGWTPITNQKVNGVVIDDVKCINLWQPPDEEHKKSCDLKKFEVDYKKRHKKAPVHMK